jgi:hypothetical protein
MWTIGSPTFSLITTAYFVIRLNGVGAQVVRQVDIVCRNRGVFWKTSATHVSSGSKWTETERKEKVNDNVEADGVNSSSCTLPFSSYRE